MGVVVGKTKVVDRTVVVRGAAVVATGVPVVNGGVNVVDGGVLARGPVVAGRVVTRAEEVAAGVDEVVAGVEDTGKGLISSAMGADSPARYSPSGDPENWAVILYACAWLKVVMMLACPCIMNRGFRWPNRVMCEPCMVG